MLAKPYDISDDSPQLSFSPGNQRPNSSINFMSSANIDSLVLTNGQYRRSSPYNFQIVTICVYVLEECIPFSITLSDDSTHFSPGRYKVLTSIFGEILPAG
jgi:hypothetical protein